MNSVVAERPLQCLNCGASLAAEPAPRFCAQCGQETTLHAPTFAEFMHEFAGHFVAVEGTLWRTLRLLFTAPGRLTSEYFAGRRRRYVAPLRLYLSASFIFFLVVKIVAASGALGIVFAPAVNRNGEPITAQRDPVTYQATLGRLHHCIDDAAACGWFSRANAKIGLKALQLADRSDAIAEHLVGMAPYALFILLPLFAAIVMLAYRRRHLAYGAHFVFALHAYSFALLFLAIAVLLPEPFTAWATLAVMAYVLWSMHAVYGGGWWPTLLRGALIAVLYGAALLIALVVLSIGSVLAV